MAQYRYYAGKDLNLGKNLRVKRGDPLPDRWQTATLVRWLRNKLGDAAVLARSVEIGRRDEPRYQERVTAS